MNIIIDAEFARLIPPPTADEFDRLRASILKNGCREPLAVWEGHDILLDGHNRLSICKEAGLPYETTPVRLADREAAHDWIILNQLGRRNLSDYDRSLLIGKLYNETKQRNGGKRGAVAHREQLVDTAAVIAEKAGVSRATVVRAGRKAEAVEKIAAGTGLTQRDVARALSVKEAEWIAARPTVFDSIREPAQLKEAAAGTAKPDTEADAMLAAAAACPVFGNVNALVLSDDLRAWMSLSPRWVSVRRDLMAAVKAGRDNGNAPLVAETRRFLSIADPAGWKLCAPCKGKGCDACGGAGYHVRVGKS